MPDIFISNKGQGATPRTEAQREALPGHTHNLLAAFSYYPDPGKVCFDTQGDEEVIILLLRRHVITNLGWILTFILMIFAPLVLNFFPLLSFLPTRFQFIGILIWYLITTAFVLENFLDWFFNVYIITNERVIDVDFLNLIYRQMTDADIERIQDVTVKLGGVIRTVFNYGNLLIQTAGEIPEIEFEAVPNPDRVAKILHELRIKKEEGGHL